jgi:tetratricopeptide (TPR) repeat protein
MTAAIGFAQPAGNKPANANPAGRKPADNTQPMSPQQKQEQQIFGQLAKAWSSLYADKYEDAVTQAEAVVAKAGTQYRNLALEAVHVQARAYLAQGSKPAQAKARQLWQQLEQLTKTSTSGAPATRVKIAKALEIEDAAGGEPKPSPSKGEVAPPGAGGGVNPAKPIDPAKLAQAIAALEPIVKAGQPNPAAAEAGIDLARLYCKARRPDDAKAALQAVIDMMSGKDNVTRMEIPDALAKVYVNAAKAAMKDIKYDVNDGLAEFEAAEKLRKSEKFADAMKAYQAVAQNFPTTDYAPRSELHIGDCLLGLNQTAAAMAHWKKFIAPAPAGPWRGQAYVSIIDYCLEEQLDLPEAGKYADLARNSLPAALADRGTGSGNSRSGISHLKSAIGGERPPLPGPGPSVKTLTNTGGTVSSPAESWSLVAFDIHLRVGLVSFCQGQTAQAVSAFQAAKAATTNKATAESLDALIAAAKTGKAVIPEDCRDGGSLRHGVAEGEAGPARSEIWNSKSAISLALSMGIIHLLAGRPDNADNMFDRVLGPNSSPSGGGKGGGGISHLKSAIGGQRPPLPGATPAQTAFATFGRGAVLQARKKLDDAKAQFLASIKAFPTGSWHDETLYRLATITQDEADVKSGKADESAKDSPKPEIRNPQSAIRNQERLAAFIKAKSAALPYWQEIISRYPKSPRCEQAFYNAGVLLCELAEAADAAGQRSSNSEANWKRAAFMLGRFTEFYPKSPFVGDAYVREIDIALERMFDLKHAQTLAPLVVQWAEGAAERAAAVKSSITPLGLPAWSMAKGSSNPDASKDFVIYGAYIRAGIVAYLGGDMDAAQRRFTAAKRCAPPLGFEVVRGHVPNGVERLIAATVATQRLTPLEALDEKHAKATLILQLADLYDLAQDYENSRSLCGMIILGGIQATNEQKSWALFRRGRTFFCMADEERDPVAAKKDYLAAVEASPKMPWAYRGLFLAGNIAFNTEQDIETAVSLWQRVMKDYPDCPEAHRSAYYIGVAYQLSGKAEEARKAFEAFLKKFPESPFVPLVKTRHLPELSTRGPVTTLKK